MIVGKNFEDDDNDILKWVQHDSYSNLLFKIFRTAANHYLNDIRYTRDFPDFIPIILNLKSFDHRVLQNAHDLIAAFYRYAFCPHKDIVDIPSDFDKKTYYLKSWKIFFYQEVALLVQFESIAEAIVTAVAFQNSDRGYIAEEKLEELLYQRYRCPRIIINNPNQ